MSIFRSIMGNRSFEHMYIKDWNKLKVIVDALKTLGARVVLTQGVFDMYHVGHGLYLQKARGCGDVLIVGVDSDELTKERKGPKRPLDSEDDRVRALSLLSSVDVLTLRQSSKKEHLDKLVEIIKPDIFVVSTSTGDINKETIERLNPHCGEIVTLPPQATTSTTARIREVMLDGADEMAMHLQKSASEYLVGLKNGGG